VNTAFAAPAANAADAAAVSIREITERSIELIAATGLGPVMA